LWYVGGILLPEQEQDGFAVFEDEDFVYIKRFGEVCLVFRASGLTRDSIREEVERMRSGGGNRF